jgi:hypothetical protein
MPEQALIPVDNLHHKVLAPVERDPRTSLMALAEQYFRTQVAGQAEGTLDAKQLDLACFLTFYVKLYGHDDRREWFKSVTEAFLKALARGQVPRPSKRGEGKPQRLSQSTIARTYATVRHFARWIHKHVAVFPLGCPTDGAKTPEEEEPRGSHRADTPCHWLTATWWSGVVPPDYVITASCRSRRGITPWWAGTAST